MVTIKDIAKVAGVSHTTVSRALNQNSVIKAETRQRIIRIAAEMNYVPNFNAKSLVTHKTYTIGLFFSSIETGTSSSFLADVLKGIYEKLDERYILSVSAIENITDYEQNLKNRYDGILVLSQSDTDNEFIYQVKKIGIPLIVMNRYFDDDTVVNIVGDDRSGVEKAIQYACELGHRHFGIIEGIPNFKSTIERKQGFINAILKNNANVIPEAVQVGDYSTESGKRAMGKILQLSHLPTLVFCSNDDMAIGAMNACFENGISVPHQLSIIGFDDIPFSKYTNPGLTTVQKPIEAMSKQALAYLVKLIDGENQADLPSQTLCETQLIVRNTVKSLN